MLLVHVGNFFELVNSGTPKQVQTAILDGTNVNQPQQGRPNASDVRRGWQPEARGHRRPTEGWSEQEAEIERGKDGLDYAAGKDNLKGRGRT